MWDEPRSLSGDFFLQCKAQNVQNTNWVQTRLWLSWPDFTECIFYFYKLSRWKKRSAGIHKENSVSPGCNCVSFKGFLLMRTKDFEKAPIAFVPEPQTAPQPSLHLLLWPWWQRSGLPLQPLLYFWFEDLSGDCIDILSFCCNPSIYLHIEEKKPDFLTRLELLVAFHLGKAPKQY